MTPPPKHASDGEKGARRYPETQRNGSVRAAFDHETPKRTRTRLDSSGSTRGAFYTGGNEQPHHHHPVHGPRRKKKTPKKSPPKSGLSSNAQEMGDMASLAMAGLDGDDIRILFRWNQSTQGKATPTRVIRIANEPNGLETIMDGYDDSGDLSSEGLEYPRRSIQASAPPPSSRRLLASTRAQQSEQSLDFNSLTRGTPLRNSAFRGEESMQYSEATLDNHESANNSNFLRHLRSDDVPLSMRTTESSGLHGMGIPLSMRTTDTNVMMNDYNVEVAIPPTSTK